MSSLVSLLTADTFKTLIEVKEVHMTNCIKIDPLTKESEGRIFFE